MDEARALVAAVVTIQYDDGSVSTLTGISL